MAGRLNTRFLIVIAVSFVVLVAIVLGLFFGFVYKSVDDYIAKGDEYYNLARYPAAAREYGKAIARGGTGNVDLLIKLFDAKSLVKVKFGAQARKSYTQLLNLMETAIREAPENVEGFLRLIDIYMVLGEQLDVNTIWTQMYDIADQALADSPSMIEARKYRGVAMVNRMRAGLDLKDEQLESAKQDLRAFLKTSPDDIDSIYHLALLHVLEAEQLEVMSGVVGDEILEGLREDAQSLTDEARRRDPDNVRRQIDHVRILLLCKEYDRTKPLVEQIEAQMLDRPGTRFEFLKLWMAISKVELPDADISATPEQYAAIRDRVHKLLTVAVDTYPNDLFLKGFYVTTIDQTDQASETEALAIYEQIRETSVRETPIEAFIQTRAQQRATLSQATLRLRMAARATDGEKRVQKLSKVDELLEEIRASEGTDSPEYNLLVGKLRSLQGRWFESVDHLNRANASFDNRNLELLILLAAALEKTDQGGKVIELYKTLLESDAMSNKLAVRKQLTKVAIKHKQFDLAREQIDLIRSRAATEPAAATAALQLELALATVREDRGRALEILDQLKEVESVDEMDISIRRVQILIADERTDDARALLEELFEQNPSHATVLRMLISITEDKEQSLALLRQAKAADPDSDLMIWIDQTEQLLSGAVTEFEFAMMQADLISDPMTRHVFHYQLLMRSDKPDEAEAEFVKASELDPNHSWVIRMQFNRALKSKQWDQARAIASRAGEQNLDHVSGAFYLGRIEMARRRFDRAVLNYKEGLDNYPEYSDGWRLLGDAQRAAVILSAAVDSYQRALKLKPDNIQALHGLALAYTALDQRDEALEQLAKANEYSRNNRYFRTAYLNYEYRHGDKEKAMQKRRELAESQPEDTDNRHRLALWLAESKKFDQARAIADKLIEDNGRTLANVELLAELIRQAGNKKEARSSLQDYVKELGDQATVDDWLALARLLLRLEIFEEAKLTYDKAITLEDPLLKPATLELADQLYARGKDEYAMLLYDDLIKTLPDGRDPAIRYVEMLIRNGDIERAEEILEDLISRHGSDDTTYLLSAMIAAVQNDAQRAMTALDEAEKIRPQRAMIYFLRARLFASMRDGASKAMQEISRALEFNPNLLRARLLRATLLTREEDFDAAILELRGVLQKDEKSINARTQLSGLYQYTKKLEKAEKLLKESRKLFPKDARWPYQLAHVARLKNQPAVAAEYMESVFQLDPSLDNLVVLVTTYIEAKHPDKAIDKLTEHQGLIDPNPRQFHGLIGWALGADDQMESAANHFKKAIAACNNVAELSSVASQMGRGLGRSRTRTVLEEAIDETNRVWISLFLAQYDVDDHDFESAKARLRPIEPQVPLDDRSRIWLDHMLAISLDQTREYEAAREAYERLVAQNSPNLIETLNNLAYLLCENLDQPDQALPHAERANELRPSHPQIQDTLGWIHHRLNNTEQAIETLRNSVEGSELPANCLHLAKALLKRNKNGDRDEAIGLAKSAERLARRYGQAGELEGATVLLQKLGQ